LGVRFPLRFWLSSPLPPFLSSFPTGLLWSFTFLCIAFFIPTWPEPFSLLAFLIFPFAPTASQLLCLEDLPSLTSVPLLTQSSFCFNPLRRSGCVHRAPWLGSFSSLHLPPSPPTPRFAFSLIPMSVSFPVRLSRAASVRFILYLQTVILLFPHSSVGKTFSFSQAGFFFKFFSPPTLDFSQPQHIARFSHLLRIILSNIRPPPPQSPSDPPHFIIFLLPAPSSKCLAYHFPVFHSPLSGYPFVVVFFRPPPRGSITSSVRTTLLYRHNQFGRHLSPSISPSSECASLLFSRSSRAPTISPTTNSLSFHLPVRLTVSFLIVSRRSFRPIETLLRPPRVSATLGSSPHSFFLHP